MTPEQRNERRHAMRRMSDVELDHELRIREIETWRERFIGAGVAVSLMFGAAASAAGVIVAIAKN